MRNKSHRKTRPLFMTMRLGLALFAIASLGACATTKLPGSAAGLCDIIPKAKYAVLGKTQYDQDFVDEAVTAGASCGHPAPEARPAELDKAPIVQAPPAVARKPTLRERLKRTISRRPGTVDPVASPIVVPASLPQIGQPLPPPDPEPPTPAALPKPRSPVEMLLDPEGRRS